jgi:hypothetical protein
MENLGKVHIVLPVKAREYVKDPGYLERLRKRQVSLETSVKEIESSIERVEECKLRVSERAEALIKDISLYRYHTLQELDSYKELLEKAIRDVKSEVGTHIYEENYVPLSGLVTAVWTSSPAQLSLFKFSNKGQYQVKILKMLDTDMNLVLESKEAKPPCPEPMPKPEPPVETPVKKLSRSEKRKKKPEASTPTTITPAQSGTISPLSPFDPSSTLIHANAGYAYAYNCISHLDVKTVPLPTQTSTLSTMLFLPNWNILILGKETPPLSAVAIEVNLLTGEQVIHPDMFEKRYGHGVLCDGHSVFVFGGSGTEGRLSACEAFGLQSKSWRRLASMITQRDFFNPCLYAGFGYILGGRKTSLCEKYSLALDIFCPLQVKTPISGQCSAVLVSDSIILVQRKIVAKWRIEEAALESVAQGYTDNCWGTMSPIAIADIMYIAMPPPPQGKVILVKLPS